MKEEPIDSPQDNISDSDMIFDIILDSAINLHSFIAIITPGMLMSAPPTTNPNILTMANMPTPSIINSFLASEEKCISHCDAVAREHGFVITSPDYLAARDKLIKKLFLINLEKYRDMKQFTHSHMYENQRRSNIAPPTELQEKYFSIFGMPSSEDEDIEE